MGTMETLIKIAQKQGWKQLFSGLSINYLKVVEPPIQSVYSLFLFLQIENQNLNFYLIQVVPSVAIGFTVYDLMKLYLRVPSRDEAVVEVVTHKRNIQSSSLRS